MTHPCADHPCDHCYLCDVVGICCQTVRSGAVASISARDPDYSLRQAILAESRLPSPDLLSLVRVEALRASPPWAALPSVSEPLPLLSIEHQKEGARHEHEQIARPSD
jgi:hypothetical protein